MNIAENRIGPLLGFIASFEQMRFTMAPQPELDAALNRIFKEAVKQMCLKPNKALRKEIKHWMIACIRKNSDFIAASKVNAFFEDLKQSIGSEKAKYQRLKCFRFDEDGPQALEYFNTNRQIFDSRIKRLVDKAAIVKKLRPVEIDLLCFLESHYPDLVDITKIPLLNSIGLESLTAENRKRILHLLLKQLKRTPKEAASQLLDKIFTEDKPKITNCFKELILQLLDREEPPDNSQIYLLSYLSSKRPELDLNSFTIHLSFVHKVFFQAGINPETPGLFKQCPIKVACDSDDFPSLGFLLSAGYKLTSLHNMACLNALIHRFFGSEERIAAADPELAKIQVDVLKQIFTSSPRFLSTQFKLEHYQRLVTHGIPIACKNAFRDSPLGTAIERQNLEEIQFLLRNGVSIRELFEKRFIIPKVKIALKSRYFIGFAFPLRNSHIELTKRFLRFLIEQGAVNYNEGEFEDLLFVQFLEHFSEKEIPAIQQIMQFDLTRRNRNGETLLTWAMNNRPQIVENLLLLNPDVTATDHAGKCALYYAFEKGSRHIESILLRYLGKGGDPNLEINSHGDSLLIGLIRRRFWAYLPTLLAEAPDINKKDKSGNTALKAAFDEENIDLMIKLISLGANQFDCLKTDPPRQPDDERNRPVYDGDSLFIYAAKTKWMKFIEFLLSKGASINTVNNKGETLLHYAARTKNQELIDFCMKRKADINVKNVEGDSPIVYSLLLSDDRAALCLMEAGANLYCLNAYGIAPVNLIGLLQVIRTPSSEFRCYESKLLPTNPATQIETPLCFEKLKTKTTLGKSFPGMNKKDFADHMRSVLLPQADSPGKIQQLIECVLVLGIIGYIELIIKKCKPEEFVDLFAGLVAGPLKDLPIDYWLKYLAVSATTFQKAAPANEAAADSNTDINLLITYFDAINTLDPSRDDYFDPNQLLKGKFIEKRAELRNSLSDFVHDAISLTSKKKFANPEEDLKKLQQLAKELASAAERMADLRQRAIFILDIAQETVNCAVGWILSANNLKVIRDLSTGKAADETLPAYLNREFMLFRMGLLEQFSGANVHARNRWLQAMGKQLQLPEAESLGEFKDAYNNSTLDPVVCITKFKIAAHPAALCRFATAKIKEKLKADRQQSDHSCILSWFESHVPLDFKKKKYDPIEAELKANLLPWQEIFNHHGIPFNEASKLSWQEALAKAKGEDYISSEVFPNYSESPSLAAVVYLLCRLQLMEELSPGVIREILKYVQAAKRQSSGEKRKSALEIPLETKAIRITPDAQQR